jgi:hypothetical protein
MDFHFLHKTFKHARQVTEAFSELMGQAKQEYPDRIILNIQHHVTTTRVPSHGYNEAEILLTVIITYHA